MEKDITLDGNQVSIQDIHAIVYDNAHVTVSSECIDKVKQSRKFLENEVGKKITYGVNTAFGPMAPYVLSQDQLEDLQSNLIKSHAVGLGESLSEEQIVAIMVVRLNTLIKGYSGIHLETAERLQYYINHRILPVIPRHGGVGASGDLVQLAHIGLGLIGEGYVLYQGKRQRTSDVLRQLKLKPLSLKTKEGLSLVNGTSAMTGIGALLCLRAKRQYTLMIAAGALALEVIEGYADAISPKLQDLRPHPGQIHVAKDLRSILDDSQRLRKREDLQKSVSLDNSDVKKINDNVQDIYSFRCLPQIVGPVYDTIANTIQVIETEINSVTDNPIADPETQKLIHGGNFHGDYVSLEMDKLKIALARLAYLSQRHSHFFLTSHLNNFLPPYLILGKVGFNIGLQGLQYTATSTTAEIQTLCFPNYVHNIPTDSDNQDIVSMGTNSALITSQVIDGLFHVLTVEFIALVQAVDVLEIQDKLSTHSRNVYEQIRKVFKPIKDDRDLSDDLVRVSSFIENDLSLNLDF